MQSKRGNARRGGVRTGKRARFEHRILKRTFLGGANANAVDVLRYVA